MLPGGGDQERSPPCPYSPSEPAAAPSDPKQGRRPPGGGVDAFPLRLGATTVRGGHLAKQHQYCSKQVEISSKSQKISFKTQTIA